MLDRAQFEGRILRMALTKLLLQVSCGAPSFLGLLIQAAKIFLGRVVSFDLAIFPTYFAILLLMNASIFGMLRNMALTSLFLICFSLT